MAKVIEQEKKVFPRDPCDKTLLLGSLKSFQKQGVILGVEKVIDPRKNSYGKASINVVLTIVGSMDKCRLYELDDNTLLDMINANGKAFKVAFSLSGVGIEQLEMHAPQVLEKLQELNGTGCVEFLAEPYSHGLSSLINAECFAADVKKQMAKMKEYFGQTPKVLRNSSLIYSDDIGLQAAEMGFKGMLTDIQGPPQVHPRGHPLYSQSRKRDPHRLHNDNGKGRPAPSRCKENAGRR